MVDLHTFCPISERRPETCSGDHCSSRISWSCRRYAIIQGKAERAKDNPLKAAYDRRCSAIRSEKSRGTISAEFAQAAQEMAKRRLEQAEEDDAYAKTSYYADLQRAKLYADTDKRMK